MDDVEWPLDIVLTEYDVLQPDVLLFVPEGKDLTLSQVAKGSDPVQSSLLPALSLRPGGMIPA